jgi:DNA-binding NtrC family response regulator
MTTPSDDPRSDPGGASTSFLRLLVVEPDAFTRHTYLRILRRLGYDAVGTGDPDEAVDLLVRRQPPYDVVLCDISGKPGQADLPVLRAINVTQLPTRVVGVGDTPTPPAEEPAPLAAYIAKPVTVEAMEDAMRRVTGVGGHELFRHPMHFTLLGENAAQPAIAGPTIYWSEDVRARIADRSAKGPRPGNFGDRSGR